MDSLCRNLSWTRSLDVDNRDEVDPVAWDYADGRSQPGESQRLGLPSGS
jgi:hypothetical protein